MLRAALLRKSLNYKSLAAGNSYPLFYDTLFSDLRSSFTTAAENARTAKKGLWKQDLSTTGLAATNVADLEARGVVFPKLYRRLTSYFNDGGSNLASFLPWLAKTKEQVLDLATGNFTHLDNVLAVKTGKIHLTIRPRAAGLRERQDDQHHRRTLDEDLSTRKAAACEDGRASDARRSDLLRAQRAHRGPRTSPRRLRSSASRRPTADPWSRRSDPWFRRGRFALLLRFSENGIQNAPSGSGPP